MDSEGARMTKRSKLEQVPVEADSDTQRVLEWLIAALENQGFKIIKKYLNIDILRIDDRMASDIESLNRYNAVLNLLGT